MKRYCILILISNYCNVHGEVEPWATGYVLTLLWFCPEAFCDKSHYCKVNDSSWSLQISCMDFSFVCFSLPLPY